MHTPMIFQAFLREAGLLSWLILATALSTDAQVQELQVHMGPEMREFGNSTIADIVAYQDGHYYTMRQHSAGLLGTKNAFTLEKYDLDLQLVEAQDIELLQRSRLGSLERIVQFGDELYMLNAYRDKKTRFNTLFIESIDLSTLEQQKDFRKIAEIDYSGYPNDNSGVFDYKLSLDSSKMLVFYALPFDRNGQEEFGFHVYDLGLKELWDRQILLPHEDRLYDLEDFQIDENGNVYILGRVYQDNRRPKVKGEPNYHYEITAFYESGTVQETYRVELGDKFLSDMKMAVDPQGDLICAGFYGARDDVNILGSYFIKIDRESKALKAKHFDEFGIQFLTANERKGKQKRLEKRAKAGRTVDIGEYYLNDIIIRPDGGAFLVGEQFIIDINRTPMNSRFITDQYLYHYNDIIVININPDGTIKWTQKIPKRQISENDFGYYSSYTQYYRGDQLFFVFNDNARNLNYTGTGRVEVFNGRANSVVTLVELTPAGKQIRQALFDLREAQMITRPKVSEQVSPEHMILFGEYGRRERFVRLSFLQ